MTVFARLSSYLNYDNLGKKQVPRMWCQQTDSVRAVRAVPSHLIPHAALQIGV